MTISFHSADLFSAYMYNLDRNGRGTCSPCSNYENATRNISLLSYWELDRCYGTRSETRNGLKTSPLCRARESWTDPLKVLGWMTATHTWVNCSQTISTTSATPVLTRTQAWRSVSAMSRFESCRRVAQAKTWLYNSERSITTLLGYQNLNEDQ